MLKKLKLTLLMSGVIFFPKGTYAADQDENLKTVAPRLAFSSGRPASSLLPAFVYEQDVNMQPYAGPSSSQVSIGSSSSGTDFSPEQLPGGLTIRGRDLYADVWRSNIETNIDLKKYFNFSDIQECKEAIKSVSIITQFLNEEAKKPLKEIEKTLEELEDQFRAQLKAQFKEGLERSSESLGFTTRLLDLKWASDDEEAEKATKKILSSYSNMLEDLPLYIELFQQKKYADDFIDKVYDKIDEPEGFTEAALVDILKETPENSRNLIKRMAGPFLKMSNLSKSKEQIPPLLENSEVDPKKDKLHGRLTKTRSGWSLFSDVLKSDIGTNVDLTKYFNFSDDQGRQEAGETVLIVLKLLGRDLQEPLEELEKKQRELEKKLEELEGQEELYLFAQNQLEKMLDDEVSIEDFLLSSSALLEDPKFQGSELSLYVDRIQQAKFVGDFFERVDKVKNFTEATLVDILKEIPEKSRSSRNLIERVASPFFKMKSLKKSVKQALLPENEYLSWIAEAKAVSAAPVEPIEALASTFQTSFPSSSMSLPHEEEAIPTRTLGKIAINGDDAPLSVLSFPGDFKLADTLREKRLGEHPLSVSITSDADEIKGDGFNYYFTVPRDQIAPLNNATLRFQVEMKSNAPAYIEYWDGLKEIRSASHSGSGQWETLTVEFTVNSEAGRWFNFYPAILSAVEGIENPSTQIRNCILHYKK
jgi:hypothetical protein